MNCSEIQQKLSAFIDGIVSSEEKTFIEDHLKSCSKCSESLEDLRKTVDYVQRLDDIEPPDWLRQKIIAGIRPETELKKGILKKLFYPLHVKLPIEAAAIIFIAITALYIFRTIQPEVKIAKAPSEELTKQIPLPLSQPLETTTPSSHLEKTIPSPLPNEKKAKGEFEEQPAPAKNPAIMDKSAEEPQAPAQLAKRDEVGPSAGAASKEESRTGALSGAAKEKVIAERKETVSISIRVSDVRTASQDIEKTLMQFEGKITKTEYLENRELVTAEIDSQKLEEFIDNLKYIGEIEKKEWIFEAYKHDVQIKIEIVKISGQLQ